MRYGFLWLALGLSPSALAQNPMTVASKEVYRSTDGVTVAIVGIKRLGKPVPEALVEIARSGSKWDNQPMLHHVVTTAGEVSYETKVNGKVFATVITKGRDTSYGSTFLNVPDKPDNFVISVDKKLTEAFNGEAMIMAYERTFHEPMPSPAPPVLKGKKK